MIEQRPKPKFEGDFVFKDIQEGHVVISFDPPLKIHYTIWEKKLPDGTDAFPEDAPMMAFAKYDFGMEMMTAVDIEHNWLMNGYEGLKKDSPPEDVLMYSLVYDLFHAFCHIPDDPNYTHYHWALNGWLKDRAKVSDPDA